MKYLHDLLVHGKGQLIMYAWKHVDNNSSLLARVNERVNCSPTANQSISHTQRKLTDFTYTIDPLDRSFTRSFRNLIKDRNVDNGNRWIILV